MPPSRRHYYDPIVQSPGEPSLPPEVRAIELPIAGHWLLARDVVALLRYEAQMHGHAEVRDYLSRLADIWDMGNGNGETMAFEPQVYDPPTLERVELFPDAAGKWHGRSIDVNGDIVEVLPGDFNIRGAEAQIAERWPDLTIYQLEREIDDSTWDRMGPSPRLWKQQAN